MQQLAANFLLTTKAYPTSQTGGSSNLANATAQRRGQNPHLPPTEPKSCEAPRFPRLLQRVVRRWLRG
jgi:hypothetical protein